MNWVRRVVKVQNNWLSDNQLLNALQNVRCVLRFVMTACNWLKGCFVSHFVRSSQWRARWGWELPVAALQCKDWSFCSDGFRATRTAAVQQLIKQFRDLRRYIVINGIVIASKAMQSPLQSCLGSTFVFLAQVPWVLCITYTAYSVPHTLGKVYHMHQIQLYLHHIFLLNNLPSQ